MPAAIPCLAGPAEPGALESAQAGLVAVNQLLPRLLAPEQRVGELSALADRRPGAVATWLQGEREYRSFNFARALEFARRAVKRGLDLAIAAIRGAQAAKLAERDAGGRRACRRGAAAGLAAAGTHGAVCPRSPCLSEWPRRFGGGVAHQGDADESGVDRGPYVVGRGLLSPPPRRSMAPSTPSPKRSSAAAADSGFSPPRFHLAELAIRSGDTSRAMGGVTTSCDWPRTTPA